MRAPASSQQLGRPCSRHPLGQRRTRVRPEASFPRVTLAHAGHTLAAWRPPELPRPSRFPCRRNCRHRSLQANGRRSGGQELRLRAMPSERRRYARQADGAAGLLRLPRRRSHRSSTKSRGARSPAASASLAHLGESGAQLHALESRIAGVHSLCESRRFARRPHQLRHDRLPRQRSAASPHQHDDARLHAVGRGPLQQRLVSAQVGAASAKATA